MAIARDTHAHLGVSTTGTTHTVAYTCTGSARALTVFTVGEFTDNITTVSYNGVSMTLVDTVTPGGVDRYVKSWLLINPSSGSNNIVVSKSNNTYSQIWGSSYTGVNQTGQPDAHNTASGASASSMTATLTTVADNSWLVALLSRNTAANWTVGSNTTFLDDDGNTPPTKELADSNGVITPAGATSLGASWDSSAAFYGGVVLSLSPQSTTTSTSTSSSTSTTSTSSSTTSSTTTSTSTTRTTTSTTTTSTSTTRTTTSTSTTSTSTTSTSSTTTYPYEFSVDLGL